MNARALLLLLLPLLLETSLPVPSQAATSPPPPAPGDAELAEYFRTETARLSERCLADIQTLDDWNSRRAEYRQQLFEMLGLSPLPARSDLKPVVTGKLEQADFAVEKLHFQSLPGLYVTANLYLPKPLTHPAPAILYVCGHGPVISNNVSYGNKVAYQHHGAWFARNGYVCLVIDTLQLGEIQGLHHGTYREGLWWWNARGYTPAGVEAWNSLRALDYLATRPEVDTNRFGVTGRSGGGAYSWWLAALDDRVKTAAPVAGITDLQNHVVDGVVEGHCDCMFIVNTYRWDYPLVAALVAPRSLLLVNTDSDTLFPLDGVVRVHDQVKRIYALHQAADHYGLVIGPGPHKDSQNLQVPVLRWFNQHLKGEDPAIAMAAVKFFQPEQLKVFDRLPEDAIHSNIHTRFVAQAAVPAPPASTADWQEQRDAWMTVLRTKVFAGWPGESRSLNLREQWSVSRFGLRFRALDFESQEHVPLRLYLVQGTGKAERVLLTILNAPDTPAPTNRSATSTAPEASDPVPPLVFDRWLAAMRAAFPEELADEVMAEPVASSIDERGFGFLTQHLTTNRAVLAYMVPRGIGLGAWNPNPKKQIQIRRRFMLLGQTLDGMRVWDIRRAIQAIRSIRGVDNLPVCVQAQGNLACDALYASLFEDRIERLDLWQLPGSHERGPDYLNVLRWLDIPQAVAMAVERSTVNLLRAEPGAWDYSQAVAKAIGGTGK